MTDNAAHPVVLAEDDTPTRALLAHQLERAGYRVIGCADGKQALNAIRRVGSGVLIADWSIPQMDGLALCRAIRQMQQVELLGIVYFILLTARNEKSDVVRGLEAGADDYLTKPYHWEELLARLRVGGRILGLQDELIRRQTEVHKVNTQMAALNAQLEKAANTDALTEMANRRHVFERLSELWSLAERHNHPTACIMLDVDHFKRVNDTYGHATGDEVLKTVARIIAEQVRRYDVCGRFGGEEFIIICPETTVEDAGKLAERVRAAIEAHPVAVENASIAVRLSAGVAARRPDDAKPDSMIAEADAMLYHAKQNGRNQVWVADGKGQGHALSAGRPSV
jgi:two-component system cell cycle response regulator